MVRKLSDVLEEITCYEIAINSTGDPGGFLANRLAILKQEAKAHPDARAGKDLPPIEGKIG